MFKKTVVALTVGTALTFAAVSTASANGLYLGAGVTQWDLSADDFASYDATGLSIRVGYDYNEYLALETHATFGGSDNATLPSYYGPVESELDLDILLSTFVKGKLPITPEFRAYGLVGVTYFQFSEKLTAAYGTGTAKGDDTNFAAGIGAEFDITRNFTVGADYIRHSLDKSHYDLDTVSLVGAYRF